MAIDRRPDPRLADLHGVGHRERPIARCRRGCAPDSLRKATPGVRRTARCFGTSATASANTMSAIDTSPSSRRGNAPVRSTASPSATTRQPSLRGDEAERNSDHDADHRDRARDPASTDPIWLRVYPSTRSTARSRRRSLAVMKIDCANATAPSNRKNSASTSGRRLIWSRLRTGPGACGRLSSLMP